MDGFEVSIEGPYGPISTHLIKAWTVFSLFLSSLVLGSAQQCGSQADGALCPGHRCCSKWGWCGDTDEYCKTENGCQSQCSDNGGDSGGDTSGGIADLISKEMFEEMLLHRNDPACPAAGFYTYDAFVAAATSFPEFPAVEEDDGFHPMVLAHGDIAKMRKITPFQITAIGDTKKCSIVFLGSNIMAGVPYNFLGNCMIFLHPHHYAFWFWMTPQPSKPSCHDAITGEWSASTADLRARRLPGYCTITNIINGGIECGWDGTDREMTALGSIRGIVTFLELAMVTIWIAAC
ncbi:hypothetical protein DITRI_Ditri08aG0146500 [Diplodiscus trichospermus]